MTEALNWPEFEDETVLSIAPQMPVEEALSLSVSPNPVSNAAVVTGAEGGDLTVLDAAGRIVFVAQNVRFPFVLDAGNWAPGVYALRLSSEKGQEVTRLVKR